MLIGSASLTVSDVRRGKAVVHEDTVGFGHFQIHHVCSVFQGSHGIFMGHLLQTRTVHLTHTHTHIIEQDTNNRQPSGFCAIPVVTASDSQLGVCLRSAACRLCVRHLLR